MGYSVRKLTADEFPSQLLEIPQPPKELWLAGTLPPPETVLLTVVGSRKYTNYGKEVCDELISGLAGYDVAIISGLAIGTDTNAHNAALKYGLKTIAVPGSGLGPKVIYPRDNVQLAQKIVDEGGALLSEFAPDFKATTWSFPKRNRIMAGLAKASLIIEATEKSGTLITARLATDYNRDVFAVPGDIFAPSSIGSNRLITQGATPITGSKDLLIALGFTPEEELAPELDIDLEKLPPEERQVMEFLSEARSREDIIQSLALDVSTANILLMKMEIAGLLKETPSGLRRA